MTLATLPPSESCALPILCLVLLAGCVEEPSPADSPAGADAGPPASAGPAPGSGADSAGAAPGSVGLSAAARGWTLESTLVPSGTTALLQAVSPVDDSVVWVSGHEATWSRSLDGGATWQTGRVPGPEERQFRDVHAFSADEALLMSAGTGAESRILRTGDGGATWSEVFVMDHPEGFLDCMAFWPDGRGLAYGDAVEGELYILRTRDRGRSWSRIPPVGLPDALPGEGGFAASGSCVSTDEGDGAWIATGNGPTPRLLRTVDGGRTWTTADLPLAAGEGRGATTVGFRPDGLGFALGGDLSPTGEGIRVALSADDGVSWSVGGDPAMGRAVYGAAWIPGLDPPTLVAAGPDGLDWSRDGGLSWTPVEQGNLWAVAFHGPGAGWAVGAEGRILRLRVAR